MFVAMKAFMIHQGKVLIIRESGKYDEGTREGQYDILGGRIEPGEHFMESLIREIKEETGLTSINVGRPFFVQEWRPVVKGEQWHIVATFFKCSTENPEIILGNDFDHYRWIDPAEYRDHGLIENLHPAFEAYLDL